jgi:hypothetical protein
MQLEYSSLSLALIVLFAQYMQDSLMHALWLTQLCTSLIHHASGYASTTLQKIDIALCHINSAVCVYYTVVSAIRGYVILLPMVTMNVMLFVHLVNVYHLTPDRTDEQHNSIHYGATIAACNTIIMRSIL